MKKTVSIPFAVGLLAPSFAFGQARVIITEIMYNPASHQKNVEAEWVEIANVGSEAIEIKDWHLDDEDKGTWGKFSCTLAPGAVAVLINGETISEEQFRAAWDEAPRGSESAAGLDYQIIPVAWAALANSPTADDEVLQLLNDKDEVICEIRQTGGWPSAKNPDGPSIYLGDFSAANLSDGKLWRRSEPGKDGARVCRQSDKFNGEDIGSPGFIPNAATAKAPPGAAPEAPPADKPADKPKSGAGIDY
jgi:hypothetical protein